MADNPSIQEVKQSLINELGRPFNHLEDHIFNNYGNDVDARVYIENGELKYETYTPINF